MINLISCQNRREFDGVREQSSGPYEGWKPERRVGRVLGVEREENQKMIFHKIVSIIDDMRVCSADEKRSMSIQISSFPKSLHSN